MPHLWVTIHGDFDDDTQVWLDEHAPAILASQGWYDPVIVEIAADHLTIDALAPEFVDDIRARSLDGIEKMIVSGGGTYRGGKLERAPAAAVEARRQLDDARQLAVDRVRLAVDRDPERYVEVWAESKRFATAARNQAKLDEERAFTVLQDLPKGRLRDDDGEQLAGARIRDVRVKWRYDDLESAILRSIDYSDDAAEGPAEQALRLWQAAVSNGGGKERGIESMGFEADEFCETYPRHEVVLTDAGKHRFPTQPEEME